MMNLELSEALEDEYSRAGDLDVHDWRREGFNDLCPVRRDLTGYYSSSFPSYRLNPQWRA